MIAAKAVAFGEALDPSYKEYQKQVQKNAKAMAEAFTKRGTNRFRGYGQPPDARRSSHEVPRTDR